MGNKTEFAIHTEFITLGQLVKAVGMIGMGGEIREFLYQNEVLINSEVDKRRGRKIRAGDVVIIGETEISVTQREK